MNRLYVLAVALLLGGCGPTAQIVTRTKLYVAVPDRSMFECPIVKLYPDSKTLTDVEVAKVLVQLYRNNATCKNSIDAIQKFLNDQKALMESQSP